MAKNTITEEELVTVQELPKTTYLYVCDRPDGEALVCSDPVDVPEPKDAENGIIGVYKLVEVRRIERATKSTTLQRVK